VSHLIFRVKKLVTFCEMVKLCERNPFYLIALCIVYEEGDCVIELTDLIELMFNTILNYTFLFFGFVEFV